MILKKQKHRAISQNDSVLFISYFENNLLKKPFFFGFSAGGSCSLTIPFSFASFSQNGNSLCDRQME